MFMLEALSWWLGTVLLSLADGSLTEPDFGGAPSPPGPPR